MVIIFGSINLDLIFALPRIPGAGETVLGPSTLIEPGGKGANQAVAAARDGASVLMAGAIGTDALAAGALRLLRQAGVDLARVIEVHASTGCAAIVVDPAGENAIAVGSGANLLTRASQVEDAVLGPRATLVLQMEVAAPENAALIERASAAGARIVLNLAPAAALPEPILRLVDVLVVNQNEAAWLAAHLDCAASAAALHQRLGGVAIVLTQGGAGADVASADETWHEPARAIDAVDTTAAGDCFVGVLAHGLDRGETLRDAVGRAGTAAALCCTRRGSQGSLPMAAETDGFG
ncbi:ribokinase [Rhodopila sp.]|uniref:ribokinase n=1 Tax=Rhodopila sp. TaxID=2480087 RepID=UPI003D143494